MQTDSPREYAALAKVIQSAAKLEMEAEKQNKPKTPQLHLHGHVDATQSTRHSLAAIAAKAGLPRLAERSGESSEVADEIERQVGRSRNAAGKLEVAEFFGISVETVDLWQRRECRFGQGRPARQTNTTCD